MDDFTQLSCGEVFVAIASQQVERQVAFYSQFLSVSPKPNTAAYAEFRLSALRLAIFTPNEQNAAEFSAFSSGPMSLCLEVDDLDSAIARLKSIGHAPPGDIMHTSHGQEIYAYDLDGNRLILHQSPR
ncbi:MAG: VOC family protein [Phormidesmis sp.]